MIIILFITAAASFAFAPIKIPWKKHPYNDPVAHWHKVVPLVLAFPIRMETANQEAMAVYQDPAGVELHVYTAYFERQSPGTELIDITTARLHEGAEAIMIPIAENRTIRVNKGIYKRNERMHLILFWYEMEGQVVSKWTDVKWLTLWNALTKRHTSGSVVIVSAPLRERDTTTQLLEKQVEFIRHFIIAS